MASEVVNKYIEKRYDGWLDYAKYHCTLAGMDDEAIDVLNEVLYMLLQKNTERLDRMLAAKSGKFTELDFYILQMIKLNITSVTSPYRHKYKPIPKDSNVNWQRLDIVDTEDDEPDKSEELLALYDRVREVFDGLGLSEYAKSIFSFRFFEDNSFSEWTGPEDKKELYSVYNRVQELIKEKINGRGLF